MVVGIGVAQWIIGIVVGWRHASLTKKTEASWAEDEGSDRSTTADMRLFVMVPCLNEELVIGNTVRALEAADPRLHVVVIDDGSEDDTALTAIAASAHGRTTVLERTLPHARQGKGRALNFGLTRVLQMVLDQKLDPSKVVVAVMDADGQLSDGIVPIVLGHFAHDDGVGGLQLQVRIRNTGSIITDYQDYEFWGVSAPAQVARARYGSTSLGGNGQFARLSALLMLGPTPWSDALTEDLDLSISVMAHGWKCVSTPSGWVSQQAVTSVRRLIRQRTRWMQGHVSCSRRVGELWRSERLPNAACIEGSAYLLSPILLTLPWSIMFHVALYLEFRFLTGDVPVMLFDSMAWTRASLIASWYLASFLPAFVGTWRYVRRSDGKVSWGRGFVLAHLFVAFNYVSFIAVWTALFRLLLGRNSWSKTARESEDELQTPGLVTAAAVAPHGPDDYVAIDIGRTDTRPDSAPLIAPPLASPSSPATTFEQEPSHD